MQMKSRVALVTLVLLSGNGVVSKMWKASLESGHSYEGCDMESVRDWVLNNTEDGDHDNTRARFQELADQMPQPRFVRLGDGSVEVDTFMVRSGEFGVMFTPTKEEHRIGESSGNPPEPEHRTQVGETYLQFSNSQAAEVVRDAIVRVIERLREIEDYEHPDLNVD